MKRTIAALSAVGALLAGAIAPAGAGPTKVESKSDNVKHLGQIPFPLGGELARSGRYLYASSSDGRGDNPENGGLHIIDTKTLKQVGFLHCPGNDNDVEVVRPGLVVMSFLMNRCALGTGGGLMLIDVKNPTKPRVISAINTGADTHTVKPVPGTNLLYLAGGEYIPGTDYGPSVVDISNPAKPEVVARPQTLTTDCHDISFSFTEEDRKLGFCAGALNGTGEVKVWDVTDPLNPTLISSIVNPVIQYSHYAVANPDGTLLAIDDEAFVAHDCNTDVSPTGRVWIYDISNPQTPLLQSSFAPPRGGNGGTNVGLFPEELPGDEGWVESWCMSHGLDWHPTTNNLAVTWYTGGVSVLDVNDPLQPTEAAHFQAEDSSTYSALWHAGYLFTNDHMGRGVDVFKISGLK